MQQREDTRRKEEVQHPLVIPNVSQAANHPTGVNPAFYPPFFPMTPYVDQPMPYMPPLQQLQYPVWDPHMGMWVQYPPMPVLPFHPGWGAPQGSMFDRLKLPVHDRLGSSQSDLEKRISQHPHRLDRSDELVRPVEQQVGQEFVLQRGSVKGKENVEQSVPRGEDAQSSVVKEVIKIDNNDVVMGDCFKGSVIINGSTQD
jgi:hypothetical protein